MRRIISIGDLTHSMPDSHDEVAQRANIRTALCLTVRKIISSTSMLILTLCLALSACSRGVDVNGISTQAAQTVIAEVTRDAPSPTASPPPASADPDSDPNRNSNPAAQRYTYPGCLCHSPAQRYALTSPGDSLAG